MLEKVFNGRLSVSVTVFMLSSVIVRFFGLGCIGLAFYMKYGDRLIDDDVLPALNSLEIYGMELGTFIQGVVFSTVVFFGFEFVNGIFGIYAGLNKRKNFLIAYICICLCFILVCIVEIVLWSLMYYWINNALEENIDTFHKRYSGSYLKNGYHEKWKALYDCLECCGTNGTGNTCSGVNPPSNGENFPGCFDLYSEKMNLYIQVYLGIIIVCFLCQIIGIGAADYTVIKQQMKNEGVKKLSSERRYLLCMKEYGVFRTLLKFLKETWNRTPTRIISVIVKSINMVSSIALIITSLWFIRSDLITNQEFIYYFRRMDIYGYSYHNVFTGFACCALAIGTFGIVVGIIGLVGSTKQSTALHTVTFVSSIGFGGLKIMASIFWVIMLNKLTRHADDELTELSGTDIFYTTLMLKFECCIIKTQTQGFFCYSNMHESIVNYGIAWTNHNSYIGNGLYGTYKDPKYCSEAITERLVGISGYYFAFLILGIICDFVGPVFISKEFKENQRVNVVKETKEAVHLIPWLNHLFRRDKPRSLLVSLYICLGVFMMLLETAFIVLAAIFGVSNHVNRDYIYSIGDLYVFLAIGSIVLVSCCMIIRFAGLIIVLKRWKKSLYVITTILTTNTLLTLTFLIMGSVIRKDEYPCSYEVWSPVFQNINCSSNLESTSGVAIGMFVFELISQICALIIHDRIHQYTEITDELSQSDEKKQPGLLRTVYAFLFVERQLFKNNRKLEIPVAVYVGASIVMTLLETTFIVLVCFYGFSWLLDRRWITTGLYILDEETVNIGVLFDFLKISLLALIPIISINRICGVVSVLTRRKIFLYVVSGVHAFTLLISIIFLILSSIVLRAVSRCTLDSESCPSRRYVIVGVAVAMLILEILIQVMSFLVHDRCYKYFLPDEGTESLVGPDQQKGMFLMMYDKFFRRRKKFGSGKIEVLIAVHFVIAVFFLIIEITFIVLVSVYGLSSVLDRQWITSGLSSMYKISMNLEVIFKFLSIGCLVLLPLISINRIIGIIAISCTWIKVIYVNSVIMALTLSINIVFICLGAILLHEESECQYIDALNSSTKTCPKMKAMVGIGLAIFCSEFLMQVLSIAVNDRSHKYIEQIQPNEEDDTATTDTGKGLFLMIYDKTFRRRKPFVNAVKIEVMSAVYSVTSVIVLMIEITFIVLNAVYGLSHVIDRKWITEGLSKQYITSSIDLESFYKFLSMGSIVIIPIISINRFVGLIAISTKQTKILYINFILTIVASVVTFIFVILTSVLLSAENRCTYTTNGSIHSCPEMNYIVGVLLSVLIIELLMQITHAVLSAKVKDQLRARIMDSSNPLPESRKVFHRPSHVPDLDTNIHHDDTESIS
ncbi:uncharacterized protein [Mytilus edulis]|uniref:uncharacterized protein n=1 Tax=Mytilus edulis TaxID=6550 RepID=UPI0039EE8947